MDQYNSNQDKEGITVTGESSVRIEISSLDFSLVVQEVSSVTVINSTLNGNESHVLLAVTYCQASFNNCIFSKTAGNIFAFDKTHIIINNSRVLNQSSALMALFLMSEESYLHVSNTDITDNDNLLREYPLCAILNSSFLMTYSLYARNNISRHLVSVEDYYYHCLPLLR